MNAHERKLLHMLKVQDGMIKRGNVRRTINQFVLEFGWWYNPVTLPKRVAMGTQNECVKNAFDLCLADQSFTYCEGFVIVEESESPTHHAWVTDGTGAAIDNTLRLPGVAYAGVPFKRFFVNVTNVKNNAAIKLIDDDMNGWPLLCELGDRPHEWLEHAGAGRTRITHN